MSGFVALVARDDEPVDHDVVRRLTDLLAFRGPDALEIWTEGSAGFGHALLECRDAGPADRQPCSLDGDIWITADARLDAREDLLRELQASGRVRGRTDAELILEAYRAWGEDCVDHLLGDFAFALWDGPAKRLFCARDHFGVKPFYYASTKNGLILGNTLGCLRGHPDVSARLHEAAVGDFLLFGSNQDSSTTIFSDVRRLPPAHVLTWRDGVLRLRRYWNLPPGNRVEYRRVGDYLERFREVLCLAVRDRLRTSRVGVCMSGGLDSTSVAAAAREVLRARGGAFDLRAFTIVYDRLIPDQERHYSALAASHLGMPIHQLCADDYLPFEGASDWHTPEPTTRQLSACTLDLYRLAAAHCRVVLTGDGGDALLYPNPLYLVGLLGQGRWGLWLREVFGYLFSHGKLPPLGLRTWWLHGRNRKPMVPSLPDWLDPDFVKCAGIRERWEELHQSIPEENAPHPGAHRILKSPLWTNLFEAYDAGTTGIPVEFPHPLFDLRLIDCVFSVPAFPWCIDKKLVRQAMHGLLPEQVRTRRKALLAGDPLHELLKRDGWRGKDCLPDSSPVSEFASVEKVVACSREYATPNGKDSHSAVYALCLDHWLRGLKSLDPFHPLFQEPSHAAV